MVINNVSAQYISGLLPDIIPSVDPMLLPSGNPFKCHEEVLSLQPMIPLKLNVLTFPPLIGECSEGLDAFSIFFK